MTESPETLNNQAIELAQEGFYKEAIACFKRAIAISKENYTLWYNLGLTYRDSGNLDSAAEALHQAYSINETNVEIYEALVQVYYLQKDYQRAVALNLEALDFFPDNAHIWNNLGVLYFAQEDYEMAAEAFEMAVTIYPYYYDALYNLRDTYAELGNTAGSEECSARMKALGNNGNGVFYA